MISQLNSGKKPLFSERLMDAGIVPSADYELAGLDRWKMWRNTFTEEAFRLRLWRWFKERTGYFPVLTIALHYGAWLWLLIFALGGSLYGQRHGLVFTLLGIGVGASVFFVIWVYVEDATLLSSWRRFRASQSRNDDCWR
jgi:hypothetical protein